MESMERFCTRDPEGPQFEAEWQRRAFGLAVALSEFGHYEWEDFQRQLIEAVEAWENASPTERGDWFYYERWLEALSRTVVASRLVSEDEMAALLSAEHQAG